VERVRCAACIRCFADLQRLVANLALGRLQARGQYGSGNASGSGSGGGGRLIVDGCGCLCSRSLGCSGGGGRMAPLRHDNRGGEEVVAVDRKAEIGLKGRCWQPTVAVV